MASLFSGIGTFRPLTTFERGVGRILRKATSMRYPVIRTAARSTAKWLGGRFPLDSACP